MHNFLKKAVITIFVFTIISFCFYAHSYAADGNRTINIKEGDEWHFLKGTLAPERKWHYRDFDDSAWLKGPSGFGYGPGKHKTLLDDMKDNYQTVYVRKEFTVLYHNRIKSMVLSVVCDGPFAAYLNMIEAIRSKRQGRGEPLILTGFGHELEPGINVLSIQCTNDDINSESFSFIPSFELIEE